MPKTSTAPTAKRSSRYPGPSFGTAGITICSIGQQKHHPMAAHRLLQASRTAEQFLSKAARGARTTHAHPCHQPRHHHVYVHLASCTRECHVCARNPLHTPRFTGKQQTLDGLTNPSCQMTCTSYTVTEDVHPCMLSPCYAHGLTPR